MNCIKCYQEIPDGAKFCPYCGAQQSDTSATDPVRAEETVTEPVQAAQTEEVPTEPVQAAQTEEVPTEPVQAAQTEEALTEPVQPTQTEEAPTEPIQPEAASTDHVYQEAPAQETYTSAQNNPYYGTGQTYSDQMSDQQYGGNQGQTSYQNQMPYQNQAPQTPINWVPYLVLSIICTLCCCLPFGIVGIVYAAKINSSMAAGNYEEAKNAAKSAKIWIIASAVVGLIVEVIYIIFAFIGGVGGYYYY